MKLSELEINQPSRIYIKSDQIYAVQSQNKVISKSSTLFNIDYDYDKKLFVLNSALNTFNVDNYNNWLVFNNKNTINSYSDEYKLDINDIIKIGRLRLKLFSINLDDNGKNEKYQLIPKCLNEFETNIQNIIPINRLNNETLSRTIEIGNTIQAHIENTQENYINIEDGNTINNESIAPKLEKINENHFIIDNFKKYTSGKVSIFKFSTEVGRYVEFVIVMKKK